MADFSFRGRDFTISTVVLPAAVHLTEIQKRLHFRRQLGQLKSPQFKVAVESVSAGITLLAAGDYSQSFLLCVQALEVLAKAILGEIQTLGQSAWLAQHPRLARDLAAQGADLTTVDLREPLKEKQLAAAVRGAASYVSLRSNNVETALGRLIYQTRD